MPDQIHMPVTAKEALALWDKGAALVAFRVATETATQEEIYAVAFEMIRKGNVVPTYIELGHHETLTNVEHASAHGIAFVAVNKGWAAMIQGHIHPRSPEILIRKPA